MVAVQNNVMQKIDEEQMVKKDIDNIIDLGIYPALQTAGENKGDKVEIFTPRFIVEDMVNIIGKRYVSDVSRTVLEPASGDGAFTVYILELRLNKLIKDKKSYLQKSLQAVSTIYSIEMNEYLIVKQRNNIYSLLCLFAKKKKITLTDEYHNLAKKIISNNFIWGETNIKSKVKQNLLGVEIGWYMPESNRKANNAIEFARWTINEDLSHSVVYEQGEIG